MKSQILHRYINMFILSAILYSVAKTPAIETLANWLAIASFVVLFVEMAALEWKGDAKETAKEKKKRLTAEKDKNSLEGMIPE